MFDIETANWTTFVMGAIRTKDGTETYDDEKLFLDALLSIEGDVYAHNMGRFDGLWILDRVRDRRVEIVNAAARVVTFEVGATRFCDSFALVPLSLAEWTGEKEATGLPCICPAACGCSKGCFLGGGCGGYCSIAPKMANSKRRILRSYLCNDVAILWKALADLSAFGAKHDLDLGLTIGGSAWSTVHRTLGIPKADYRSTHNRATWKGNTYEGIRDAYFGGRVQVFRPRMEAGFQADVNSMYPAMLATVPMPVGEAYESLNPARDYAGTKQGVFHARVRVPDMFLPPLPVRVRDGAGVDRIAYPTGTFEGVWTALELRAAEDFGACVEAVFDGVVWPRAEVLFDGWIERLFALRSVAGKKSSLGKWLKLYMNSLTGKFAMNPSRAMWRFNPEETRLTIHDPVKCARRCGKKCRELCGADVEVGNKGSGIWKRSVYFVNPCAHVEFAAHLTAAARVKLLKHLRDGGGNDAVYCDTDSVFSIQARTWDVGHALGQLEDKGRVRNFHALAPKIYEGEEQTSPGKWEPFFAAKGISLPQFRWASIEAGTTVETERIRGFQTGARRGLFFARDAMKRTVKLAAARENAYGDRVLDGDVTRPRDIKEFKCQR